MNKIFVVVVVVVVQLVFFNLCISNYFLASCVYTLIIQKSMRDFRLLDKLRFIKESKI